MKPAILFFISSHGYGHASRSSAIINTLHKLIDFEPVIITETPRFVFEQSLSHPFEYIKHPTDVGLIQIDSLTEDVNRTISALKSLFKIKFDKHLVTGCSILAVFSDISPIGIQFAKSNQLPTILFENFTWDWIYENYIHSHPEIQPYISRFKNLYADIDCHIQSEPICFRQPKAFRVNPVSRKSNLDKDIIYSKLNLESDKPVILITFGGVLTEFTFLEIVKKAVNYQFIIPGPYSKIIHDGNLRLLPHHSEFYHPNLVSISDLIVGKLGYSTIAEIVNQNKRFLYVSRPSFRESPAIKPYVDSHILSKEITKEQLFSGNFLDDTKILLNKNPIISSKENGAGQTAVIIAEFLKT